MSTDDESKLAAITTPLRWSGWTKDAGVDFSMPLLTVLYPHALWLVRDAACFRLAGLQCPP
jgi:hypothetical protein